MRDSHHSLISWIVSWCSSLGSSLVFPCNSYLCLYIRAILCELVTITILSRYDCIALYIRAHDNSLRRDVSISSVLNLSCYSIFPPPILCTLYLLIVTCPCSQRLSFYKVWLMAHTLLTTDSPLVRCLAYLRRSSECLRHKFHKINSDALWLDPIKVRRVCSASPRVSQALRLNPYSLILHSHRQACQHYRWV